MRFTRLANAFGPDVAYTIVAMDGRFDAAELLDPSIRVALVPLERRSLPWSALAIRKLIREVRPDLTITNNWGSMDGVLASWSAGVCPTIHSEDGFGPDEATRLKSRRVLTRRVLLNRIYTTVVPSKTLVRVAREQYRLAEEKMTFIPNGIEITHFQPGRCEATRRMLGATDETVIIGFVGHLRAEKALHVLIEAYSQAKMPNSLLVLVGDGPCRKVLAAMVERLGLAAQVRFVGHAPAPQRYLAAFDIFAMSSATEQMPLSILEAMACGLPVISTDVGDCADMLATRQSPVIVAPGNVSAYANALKLLAGQPTLRFELGTANRQRCIATYSFEKMTEAYAALYQRALSGGI